MFLQQAIELFSLRKIIRFLLVLGAGVGVWACGAYTSATEIYQVDFSSIIKRQVDQLGQEIDLLVLNAEKFQHKEISKKELQQQLQQTRYAFKKAEGALTYYYPEHIKAYVNGAPLPHPDPFPIKKDAPDYYVMSPEAYKKSLPLDVLEAGHYLGKPRVAAPEGLQTLDELIFAENELDATKILQLSKRLKSFLIPLRKHMEERAFFYDFEVLEASRLELMRIFSMGITGFDTPGSLNAINEAKYSMSGIESLTHPLINRVSSKTKNEIKQLFFEAQDYLQVHQNFETFDRLTFLKTYIDPLYAKLGILQQELGLVSSAKNYGKIASWNAESTSVFSPELLNPYYYSLLKEGQDSEKLRKLGEKLFYDKNLSNGKNISCASCHQPKLAFTDGEVKSLANINGKRVQRNAPSLINVVFSDRYFYDLRAYDLEDQAEHVIDNHLEYNTSFSKIVSELKNNPTYIRLFNEIFSEPSISRYQFSKALSSYVISLRSFNSPFDQFVRGEKSNLPVSAKRGFNLFMGKANCATCHFPPTFSGLVPPLFKENESEVLGILTAPEVLQIDRDLGRYKNNIYEDLLPIYKYSFKTTTVRNAALTAPYFHNGSYQTLEEVIDFYDKGGAAGMGLGYELPNQTLSKDPLELSAREKKDLISFINSLNGNVE